jgi:cytochrome c
MGRLLTSLAGAVALSLVSISTAGAQDAVAMGRSVFNANCAVCHMAASNGHALIGPNLYGVVGRRAASAPGFAYSPAMQHSGITWTPDRIASFVQGPMRAGRPRHRDWGR